MTTLANPIPPISLFARSLGKFKFTCINCAQEYPTRTFPWKRQDFKCDRCRAVFRFGLGFEATKGYPAYLMGKYNGWTANHLEPKGTAVESAKLYGQVEWACPSCSRPQSSFLTYDTRVECYICQAIYFVSLLIYRANKAPRIRVPLDSIVKGINETQTIQSLPDSQADPRCGEERQS